jgi:hypothetical protein
MTPGQSPAASTAVNSVASAVSPVTQQAIITSRPPQSPSLQTRSPVTTETGKPQVTGKCCMIGIGKINICKNLYSELRVQHRQCDP